MKKRLQNFTKVALLLLGVTFILNSCTEEKYYDSTSWQTIPFTVEKADWKWDDVDECYYYEFSVPEMTSYIAEKGVITGAVLLDGTYRPLEYSYYFYDDVNKMYIEETVNFEYGKNFVRFNVKSLDLFDGTAPTYLPNKHIFKITMVW